MAAGKNTRPLRIGVLIHIQVQLLDLSPIDLFGMLTRDYLAACSLPAPLVNLGVPVEIHYIYSEPFPSPAPPMKSSTSAPVFAEMTASAALRLTTHIGDQSVAPGALDLILIPGPDPRNEIPDAIGEWLRGHWERGGVTLMSVCTGIFVLAHSGVLVEHEATGPRALVASLKDRYPKVKWVDGVRWVKSSGASLSKTDGGHGGWIWTSGGITNGLDMVAAYIREHYPGPLSDTVCMLADVGDRRREYPTGKVVSNGMWVWAIVRAWCAGK